jgi:hypothetical protein
MSKIRDYFGRVGGDFERSYAGAAAQGRSLGAQQLRKGQEEAPRALLGDRGLRSKPLSMSIGEPGARSGASVDASDSTRSVGEPETPSSRRMKRRARIFLNRNIRYV